jgi:hypothetical protein
MCEICQVHLCYTSRNCFEKYHTYGALQSNEDNRYAYKCLNFVFLSLSLNFITVWKTYCCL